MAGDSWITRTALESPAPIRVRLGLRATARADTRAASRLRREEGALAASASKAESPAFATASALAANATARALESPAAMATAMTMIAALPAMPGAARKIAAIAASRQAIVPKVVTRAATAGETAIAGLLGSSMGTASPVTASSATAMKAMVSPARAASPASRAVVNSTENPITAANSVNLADSAASRIPATQEARRAWGTAPARESRRGRPSASPRRPLLACSRSRCLPMSANRVATFPRLSTSS